MLADRRRALPAPMTDNRTPRTGCSSRPRPASIEPDPPYERELPMRCATRHESTALLELYGHHVTARRVRRADAARHLARAGAELWPRRADRAAARCAAPRDLRDRSGVFVGDQAIIQGRFDGRCVIGDHVWIGPQSYFDARDLVIEDYVGWGPGAKVLGSMHTGDPRGRADHRRPTSTIKPGAHRRLVRYRRQRRRPARCDHRQGRHRRRGRRRDRGRRAVLGRRRSACPVPPLGVNGTLESST